MRSWRGEILGMAGLVGARPVGDRAGDLRRGPVFGGDTDFGRRDAESTVAAGRTIKHGIYLAPEDRRRFGVIVDMSIQNNITMPSLKRYAPGGLISAGRETTAAQTCFCGAAGQDAVGALSCPQSVGRQSAEGRAGKVAVFGAESHDFRRADARD